MDPAEILSYLKALPALFTNTCIHFKVNLLVWCALIASIPRT